MDISKDLKEFLSNAQIPEIKSKPKTFQGMVQQPHFENVISNIYAFFFNVEEEHELKDLFINSLFECIKSKNTTTILPFEMIEGFEVATEISTSKGRIDILLYNEEEVIIIENKIYHHLNGNPLNDYWVSQKKKNRIGLILSLKPIANIKKHHKDFISITHLELLETVMQNIGNYLLFSNDKYLTFLKDFYQNIINLSTNTMENEDLKFYYNHIVQFNAIDKLKQSVRNHIVSQVEDACGELNLQLYRSKGNLKKRLRYFQSTKNPNLMFTIGFEDLLKGKMNLDIYIELKYDLLKDKTKINSLVLTEKEKLLLNKGFATNSNKIWAHFANRKYTLEFDEVNALKAFIVGKVNEDGFKSLFDKINNVIEKKVMNDVI
jgi:hypothetical protein